jgi:hypothetical protein
MRRLLLMLLLLECIPGGPSGRDQIVSACIVHDHWTGCCLNGPEVTEASHTVWWPLVGGIELGARPGFDRDGAVGRRTAVTKRVTAGDWATRLRAGLHLSTPSGLRCSIAGAQASRIFVVLRFQMVFVHRIYRGRLGPSSLPKEGVMLVPSLKTASALGKQTTVQTLR